MAVKRELKELKRGSLAKVDLDWLASQPASIFKGGQNLELLSKWNSLQNTPPKVKEFVCVIHNNPRRIIKYIEETFPSNLEFHGDSMQFKDKLEYPYYAYIWHDKDRIQHPQDLDDVEKGVHVHFYFKFANQRSFRSVANELKIPVTMLEKVKYGTRAVLEYLTHENAADKHHYDSKEIHANFSILQAIHEVEDERFDCKQLWMDYRDLRLGILSYEDFYQRYERNIARHSFHQVLRIAEIAYQAAENGQTNVISVYKRGSARARDNPA